MATTCGLIFGLSPQIVADFQAIFCRYTEIERVLIFGSRAKDTATDRSDIDLAIIAPQMGETAFSRLWNELDSLPLVFKLDVLHWNTLQNRALKEKISTEGRLFYAAALSASPRPESVAD